MTRIGCGERPRVYGCTAQSTVHRPYPYRLRVSPARIASMCVANPLYRRRGDDPGRCKPMVSEEGCHMPHRAATRAHREPPKRGEIGAREVGANGRRWVHGGGGETYQHGVTPGSPVRLAGGSYRVRQTVCSEKFPRLLRNVGACVCVHRTLLTTLLHTPVLLDCRHPNNNNNTCAAQALYGID